MRMQIVCHRQSEWRKEVGWTLNLKTWEQCCCAYFISCSWQRRSTGQSWHDCPQGSGNRHLQDCRSGWGLEGRVKQQFCEFTEIVSDFVNFPCLRIYCNIYTVQTINNSPSPLRSRCFLLCSLRLCSLLLCLLLLCSLCLNVSRQEAISWVLMSSVVVYRASFTR